MGAKTTVALAAGAAVIAGVTGWYMDDETTESVSQAADRGAAPARKARLIGDGSTADTGPQRGHTPPRRLAPGQRPPQFVVFSWDGAGAGPGGQFGRFLEAGRKYGATQTFFLSGLYVLPEGERERYRPPGGRTRGASDIGFLKDENVALTIDRLRTAWQHGHEIGTHFNGHFCGPRGVASWSPAQWRSEIEQSKWFVQHWKTTTGLKNRPPLPFDYDKELIGGRAPCLEGRDNLREASADMGFRYDSSGVGKQVWPRRRDGLWDIPMQLVPMPGRDYEVLSMDYNFMVNQSDGKKDGARSKRPRWRRQMSGALLSGFERAYTTNRAPLIIGNHFEDWNGGIYMDAVEDVMRTVCPKKDVRCVSFRQLVDWLDAQDPKVLDALRRLKVGESPEPAQR